MAVDPGETRSGQSFVLGIEGGGTKTDWVLLATDTAAVVKEGALAAANLRLSDDPNLERMLRVLPRDGVSHVGAFLAGCVNEADRQRLRGIAQKIWPSAQLVVGSDRDSGFATAFRDGDGISVIAGTGSAVTGRRSGRVEKAGGWGQLLGDRGGGYNLAVQALRFVLSNYDLDHRIDSLGEDVLRRLCLTRLEELVDWAQNADKMSVAMLAPAVFEAARGGHREMREAVQAGAHILAHFTAAVARRLGFEAPCVKLQGSLFLRYAEYGSWFGDYLSEFLPAARTELCRESGALGAAWLASHALKIPSRAETRESAITELANAATEQRNPGSENLDQLLTHELVDLFVREEEHVAQALAAARDSLAGAIELVSTALQNGGRLFYVGAGTSGRLGVLDASEIPPTFGASPELVQGIIAGGATALHSAVEGAEDQRELGALAVAERGVNARDVVCGISASGRTPFVLGALSQARELGARTVLLSCNPARPRAEKWDTEIDLATGAEIVTGSTRLKAGTATKVALNIISTCSMIRFGKVRGNLMVDVKVSNAKLRDRAIRVVRAARKCSYEEAQTLLQENDWNVRATLR